MKTVTKIKERAINHFQLLGFKKKKHPGWIQMERINKDSGIVHTIEFNIKGVDENCHLYSIRSSIYFIQLSNFFTPIWNKVSDDKISKYRVFGIHPKLARSFKEMQLVDFELPKLILSFDNMESLFEELIYQYDMVQSKFFGRYVDLKFMKENLETLDDSKWNEMFGPETVFLKLYFKKLEGKKDYNTYKGILDKLVKSECKKYINEDFKAGAKKLNNKYQLLKSKLEK